MMAESLLWFLGEWALRMTILAVLAGAVLCCFRIRDVTVRLAVWRAVIYGAMLIPVVGLIAPRIPVPVRQGVTSLPQRHSGAVVVPEIRMTTTRTLAPDAEIQPTIPRRLNWPMAAMCVWVMGALVGLVRLAVGLRLSRNLVWASAAIAPGFRESQDVTVPVTVGVFRPVTLLPTDWRDWPSWKLDAVKAHERAHIERRDPLHQAAACVFRSVCWFHPLSWWLCAHTSELAEAASDDEALRAATDRNLYAEAVLDFLGRAPQRVVWEGVPMARRGSATKRIDRILSASRKLSSPLARTGTLVLTASSVVLVYLAAAARPVPAVAQPVETPKPVVVAPVAEPVQAAAVSVTPAPSNPAPRDPRSIVVVSDDVGPFIELVLPQKSSYGVLLVFRGPTGQWDMHQKLLAMVDTSSGAIHLDLSAYVGEAPTTVQDPFEPPDSTRGLTKVPLGAYTVPETGTLTVKAGVSYGLPVFRFRLGIIPATCLFNPSNFELPPSLKLVGVRQEQGGCVLQLRNESSRRLVSLGVEQKNLDGSYAGGFTMMFGLARGEYTQAQPGATFEPGHIGPQTEPGKRGDVTGFRTKITYCLFEDGTYEGDLDLVKNQLADIAGHAAQWKRIEAILKDLLARSEDEPTLLADIQSEYTRLPETDATLEEEVVTYLQPSDVKRLRNTFQSAFRSGKGYLLERIRQYRRDNHPKGAHPLPNYWELTRSSYAGDTRVAAMMLNRWLPQDVIARAIQ